MNTTTLQLSVVLSVVAIMALLYVATGFAGPVGLVIAYLLSGR